jgi:hypothetical protein
LFEGKAFCWELEKIPHRGLRTSGTSG